MRLNQQLDSDPFVWRNLVVTEIEVRRELERLDEFSDPSAPTIKDLKRKLTAIERALACLTRLGLAPAVGESEQKTDERGPWFRLPGVLAK